MDQALFVLIKGSEVNDKPELSALLRHETRRSTKLRLFIGPHLPYNPLRFQLTFYSSGLRFYIQWDRSGFETIQRQVTRLIRGIFY